MQVAYRAFDLSARGGKDFKVRLNQTGQNLLAKRGSLKVKIIVKFNKSAGLPTKTVLGTVTFRMH